MSKDFAQIANDVINRRGNAAAGIAGGDEGIRCALDRR